MLRIPDEEFDEILDAEWVDDSTVAAVSGTGASLALVESSGSTRKVGRRGEGPGEFLGLLYVASGRNGTFLTIDSKTRRLSRWTNSGRHVESVVLTGRPLGGAWNTDAGLVLRQVRAGTATAELVIVGEGARVMRPSADTVLNSRSGSLCMLCNMSVAKNGAIAIAASETSYVVNRFDSAGNRLSSIVRSKVPLISLTQVDRDSADAFRRSHTDRMRASGMDDTAIANLLRTFQAATVRARFVPGGVRHDGNGNLWLQRIVGRGARAEVDVFDANANALATLTLPVGFTILRIDDGSILGKVTQEDGRQSLLVLHNPLGKRLTGRTADSPRL